MNKRLNSRAGFTLLEILLVVIIIGMLVGVAVVKLGGKAKEAQITATRWLSSFGARSEMPWSPISIQSPVKPRRQ